MKRFLCSLTLAIGWLSQASFAASWTTVEVDDPMRQGAKCSVQQPTEPAAHVYQAASRYDQVFWPLTDTNGIWHCERSGFTAFIGDFDNLSATEVTRIAEYLSSKSAHAQGMIAKLEMLEAIYLLRDSDNILRNKLQRVLARWYQELGELDKANRYRSQALRGIQQSLSGTLQQPQRLEYLYVAANYSRQLGQAAASKQYLAQLDAALREVQDQQLFGFRDYLAALATHTPYIAAGGKLDPILPKAEPATAQPDQ